MSYRIVKPWVGAHYEAGVRGGKKLLIVGDSHYESVQTEDLTNVVIRQHAIAQPYRFFEHLRKTSLGFITPPPPAEFWNSVAFCNLVQDVLPDISASPVRHQIAEGWLALRETVRDCRPDLLLMYSRRGWDAEVPESQIIEDGAPSCVALVDGVYGLNQYPRTEQPALIAANLNHPRNSGAQAGVWMVWTEFAWSKV